MTFWVGLLIYIVIAAVLVSLSNASGRPMCDECQRRMKDEGLSGEAHLYSCRCGHWLRIED